MKTSFKTSLTPSSFGALQAALRKTLVSAALLVSLPAGLIPASAAHAQGSGKPVGCCLSGAGASAVGDLGTPLTGNLNTRWEAGLLQDAEELNRLFGVHPHMFYLRERSGPNAFATPAIYPSLLAREGATPEECPDGTIFMGLRMITEENRSTQGMLYSLPAVLAHEYAHAMQNHYRCPVQGKFRELHADYMAGYFIGHRERFAQQNVVQAMTSIFEKGDYAFNEPGHHGTPRERRDAFLAGYTFNKLSQSPSGVQAYNAGVSYLRSLGDVR